MRGLGLWACFLSLSTSGVVAIGSLIVYSVPQSRDHVGLSPDTAAIIPPPPSPAAVKPATFTPWRRELVVASHLCGVEIRRIAAITERESGWNPRAVSNSGAMGLMQLMPKTARMMGVEDAFDPLQNLIGGACYYRMMLDRFGSHHRALVAYHRGPNAKGATPQASLDYAQDVLEDIE